MSIPIDEKIVSDTCEALMGAVFIDQGFYCAKELILKVWKTNLDKSSITVLDPKTKLQEYSLKYYKKLPLYQLISSNGPKHNPVYKISVSIHGSKKFVGKGSSKQQAEQDGALQLIKNNKIK